MTPASADDLVAHARATRVVVIGAGLAGLVAALECAKVGLSVTVLEQTERFGGAIRSAELDGVVVDVGDDAFTPGDPALQSVLDDLGLAASVIAPQRTDCFIQTEAGAVPIPDDTVLGIPANAWAEDVRRIIGWRGAWRAYLDRLRPPLTIGREERLGALVRSRLGDRVADRLVAPIARGVYGVPLDALDTDAAVPGLNTALTRAGSLGGAVGQVLTEGSSLPERASIEGGMHRLVESLVERLEELGVELRTEAHVTRLERIGAGFRVHIESVSDDSAEAPAGDGSTGESTMAVRDLDADVIVVAVGRAEAARILRDVSPAVADVASAARDRAADVVSLLVDAPELDGAPHGRAVFAGAARATASHGATAVEHATAEWEWLAQRLGPGRHLLRVTLADTGDVDTGAVTGEALSDEALSDEALIERALQAARAMTGVPLAARSLRAAQVLRRHVAPPASALGRADAADAARDAAHDVAGLGIVGAWLAGSDLADIVADTLGEAERLRRAALWGPDAAHLAP